ncbi:unnamed protein product [Larinioides sclopetarius]|uniref:Uncharacterized protein n=1 Tax=Larinioides sclopetarius TaxID=280406 RepID=A0AAV2B8L1_9ARAC
MGNLSEFLLVALVILAVTDEAFAIKACLAPKLCRPVNRCCFPRDGDCPAGKVCCQMWRLT